MPVTSTITDANDAPWGAAPILNLNFNGTGIIIIITTLWKQGKTKKVFGSVKSCSSFVLKEGDNYNFNFKKREKMTVEYYIY